MLDKKETVIYSIAPDGRKYPLPSASDYKAEFARLSELVKTQRELGREIVVVMGLGFVGAVMAGVVANAEDSRGRPSKFVIGVQRPSVRSFWKINMINEGVPPFKTEDPKVEQIIRTCVLEKKNLVATYTEDALKLADIVVVDIQCDYHKLALGDVENGLVEIDDLKDALHTIGRLIPPSALVLIETTVPPGTTERIAYPIIKQEFIKRGLTGPPSDPSALSDSSDSISQGGVVKATSSNFKPQTDSSQTVILERSEGSGGVVNSSHKSLIINHKSSKGCEPLLAHSYERVMPGKDYVDSIRNFWRVCSGINSESREKVVRFLNEVLNTKDFPLTVMDRPIESETSKIVENSYRATLLAFMNEWSLFAEQNGVDITKVIKAIKVRPTHSNIMFPGPGVGGYCLPKDGALGMWAYRNILGGKENILKISTQAININDTRPLHVIDLLQEALSQAQRSKLKAQSLKPKAQSLSGLTVAVLGASYREDVGDTRYSGSEIIVRKLIELGANVRVHDPYVESWPELETNEGRGAFFKNQENLRVVSSLVPSPKSDSPQAVILEPINKVSTDFTSPSMGEDTGEGELKGEGSQGGVGEPKTYTDILLSKNLEDVLAGADAVILAVRHQPYLELFPDEVVNKAQSLKPKAQSLVILDCFGILSDKQIKRYIELGCIVKGLGRGHIGRLSEKPKA